MGSPEGNWGTPMAVLTAVFLGIVIFVLALRIFTRIHIVHHFWWDDFTIILAVLGTTIGAGLDFKEIHYGFGKHQQFLSPHNLLEFKKYTYGEWIQTFATLMWTKVSICLFLIRIPNSKPLRVPLQWAVAFLLFSNTILTTLWIMQCQPVHAAWDGQGRCMSRSDLEGIVLAQAIISVVSDFVFATLPILFLWRVQVDFTTKAGLWLLMCLGFITGAFCLVRTVLNNESLPLDMTYNGIVNWVWRLFEVSIGIIAACIPTLRPLYGYTRKKIRGEKSLGTNIRIPSSFKQSAWTETIEEARASGSDEERGRHIEEKPVHDRLSREKLDVQDILMSERRTFSGDRRGKRRDIMRDELVSQGIIHPAADGMSPTPLERASSRSSSREQLGVQDILKADRRTYNDDQKSKRRDTMRDDLIRQGILDPNADSRPISHSRPAASRSKETKAVQKDTTADETTVESTVEPEANKRGLSPAKSHGSQSPERRELGRDITKDNLLHEGIVNPRAAQRSGNTVQLPVSGDAPSAVGKEMQRLGSSGSKT